MPVSTLQLVALVGMAVNVAYLRRAIRCGTFMIIRVAGGPAGGGSLRGGTAR